MGNGAVSVIREYKVHKTTLDGRDIICLPGVFFEKLREFKRNFPAGAKVMICRNDNPEVQISGFIRYVTFICENIYLVLDPKGEEAISLNLLTLSTTENTEISITKI